MQEEFKIEGKYIELIQLLKVLGVAQTGGHAKILIQNEEVFVNGELETRVRNKLVKAFRVKKLVEKCRS